MNQNMRKDEDELLSEYEFNHSKFTPLIPMEALSIDTKVIAYWRREGLMPFIEKGKWAKLNFVEAIWLMMLNTLRNIGLPVGTMKRVTQYFIERAYKDNLPEINLKASKQVLEKKKTAGTISDEEDEQLNQIIDLLKDKQLLYLFRWDVNYFSNLITESVNYGVEAEILIFEDGTIAEYIFGSIRAFPAKDIDIYMPHIRISVLYYLKEFIASEKLSAFLSNIHLLNEDERRVLQELRNKNVREITILLNKGEITRIESTKNGVIAGRQANEIMKILGLKNYERITIDTIDEKSFSFKKTKKKIK